MSHVHEGPLATYNSLTDQNLSGYFGNTRMRRHLRKSGLINRRGEIVSENQYRVNMARKEHKKHVKNLLAQAIVHKTLDLERYRQVEIKKKLEEIAKIELVRRVRATRGRKGDEEVLPYLTPRSMSRPQSERPSESSSTQKRPKSAPAPPRHRIHSKSGYGDPYEDLYVDSGCYSRMVIYVDDDGRPVSPPPASDRSRQSSYRDVNEPIDTRHLYALDSEALQQYALKLSKMQKGRDGAMSPYLLSQIPKPPKQERAQSAKSPRRARMSAKPDGPARERKTGGVRSGQSGGSQKNPETVESEKHPTDGSLMLHRSEPAMMHQGEVQTLCEITMKYHGPNLTLPRDQYDPTQEVSIEQQHCGGNTLPVFKERLQAGSAFTFVSRRHRGYPFSLTLYIDGRVDCRVSTCCEYKHGVGVKLGGKMGHFSLTGITGATPCYKCKLSVQAPPRSLKLKRSPRLKKKRDPPGEEVTVEGTPRTPVKEKEPEVAGKSDDDYEDDFEDEGNKYEDDFEESERRQIIGLKADESRENGRTVSVNVKEKEQEEAEKEDGPIPSHRRIEGFSSEDEDMETPRQNGLKVHADVHRSTKESAKRRSSSSSSSFSSSNSTPRAKSPETRTRSPEPRTITPSPKKEAVVVSARSENSKSAPISDRSTTSTTSGDLTTETESTISKIADKYNPPSPEKKSISRRSSDSSSSSSSSSDSDSDSEKFQRKKHEERRKMDEEKRKKEEEERERERKRKAEEDEKKRKEQEEKDAERRRRLEGENAQRRKEEEEMRKRLEVERLEREERNKKLEEERQKREMDLQKRKEEEEKRKEEERKKRQEEEERRRKNYDRDLLLLKAQRESQSELIVPTYEESIAESQRSSEKESSKKTSSSSSSSGSSSEDEAAKKKSPSPPPVKATVVKKQSSGSSSSSSSSDSESEPETKAVKQLEVEKKPETPEKLGVSNKAEKSSSSSGASSSSDGEYTIDDKQKRVTDIAFTKVEDKAVIEKSKPDESQKQVEEPVVEAKKVSSEDSSSSSSDSDSDSDSEEDNKKVVSESVTPATSTTVTATSAEKPPSPAVVPAAEAPKPKDDKKSSSSSSSSGSSSSSSGESESEPSPRVVTEKHSPLPPSLQGELKRNEPLMEEVPKHAEVKKEEDKKMVKKETESEDSSSDSSDSSSGSDSSDSEDEKEKPKPAPAKTEQALIPQTHYGSILPMVEEDQDIKLACVKLNGDQLTELATNINSRYDITGVTLRNCSLDDTNFPSFATSFLKTSSRLKVLDFSQNRLGPKSMVPLAATIQKNPGIDTLTLSGNPLGNDGCKTLVNAILNTKDPFSFLRQSSGYMTPAETITKADKGEKVDFSENNGSCLKNLDLGNTNASDAAVTEFSHLLKKNKTLQSLNLTGNTGITPTGWEMLGNALKDNKTLQTLNLEGTNMGDEGVAHLTKGLRVNAGLKTLVLENCGLTEAGGKSLIELVKNNTSITDLKLQEGNTISDDTRDEIQQFLALNKC